MERFSIDAVIDTSLSPKVKTVGSPIPTELVCTSAGSRKMSRCLQKGGGERDMSMSLVVKSGEEGEGGPDDDIASLAEYSQEKLYRELPGCRPEGTSAGVKTVD
ncbi:hypothetical protein RB195_023190 [Necator americanus]|uniref:Uncharacterized protein n=1 Tax=Necator americanus TaxID=51031 RepID=A0ABR1EI62_NECAM